MPGGGGGCTLSVRICPRAVDQPAVLARCMIHNSTESTANKQRQRGMPSSQSAARLQDAGDEGAAEGIAVSEPGDHQPDAAETPAQRHRTARAARRYRSATPLPPLKPSHTGKRWPRNAPSPATIAASGPPMRPATMTATVPFSMSPMSVRAARPLASGAQHVGGADVAGADRAQIAGAGEPGQDLCRRDRTEQVAHHEGDTGEQVGRCQHWRIPSVRHAR